MDFLKEHLNKKENNMEGKIIRIVEDKGFGFIRSEETGLEYFFHRTGFNGNFEGLGRKVQRGEVKVGFVVVTNPKGPRAENVVEL